MSEMWYHFFRGTGQAKKDEPHDFENDAMRTLTWGKKTQTSNKDVRKIYCSICSTRGAGDHFFLALCSLTSKSILKTI